MNEKTLIENLMCETTKTEIQVNKIGEKMQTVQFGTEEMLNLHDHRFTLNAKLNKIKSLIEIEQALKTFNN
jgi:hypothetical protein